MSVTFDQLREKTNAALVSNRATLQQRTAELADLDGKQRQRVQRQIGASRKRIEQLMAQQAGIDLVASPHQQKIDYGGQKGGEKWQEDFLILADVQTHTGTNLEGQKLKDLVWDAIPSSRFKRFQELFVRPEHRAVPHFDIHERDTVIFSKMNFHTLSLAGCLVSADRIPDDFAEDLRLCDFSGLKGDPFGRLKKKQESIPRLKKLFESTEQLQQGQYRLLAVREAPFGVRSRYADSEGPHPAVLGTILYLREHGSDGESGASKSLTVQHFNSVYAAHRKTYHEENVYRREITTLSGLSEDINSLIPDLDQRWKDDAERPRLRERTLQVASHALSLLQACQDIEKVEAAEFAASFGTLKDRLDRENPSAALSKMVGTINRVRSRLRKMQSKGGYNQQDRMVLQEKIDLQEKVMADFRLSVERGSHHLDDKLALFNPTVPLEKKGELLANIAGLKRQMGIDPEPLERLKLEPFASYGQKLKTEYAALDAALLARDRERAKDHAIKMHIIGKFQSVRVCFESIKQFTMDAERIPVSRIREFVHDLRSVFDARQLFADHTVTSYVSSFSEMSMSLKTIEDRLAFYAGQDLDVGERSKIYRRLKKYLKMFDLEAIVRALV